ncbi:MAG: insulinase family protein, partial [Anaerotignum sp.]
MALQILSYVLLETNASPLRTALMEGDICEETEGWFDSSTYEMVFSIVAKNADVKKADAFIQIINKEWQRLISEGLPKDLLKGALRKYDFLLREEDYGSTPKGLIYCSRLMKRWLHGENPCDSLRLLEIMETLKKGSSEGYFEKLITEVFLNNEEKTYVVFTPEKGKAEKEQAAFVKKMEKRKESMTQKDFDEIKSDAEKLEIFQKQEDSPEILAQIPLLEISEIDEKPRLTQYYQEVMEHGNVFLNVPMESNGILYLKLMFDTASVPQELLPYTGLLTDLLGKLDTANYSYQELPTAMNQVFGSFSLHNNIYTKNAAAYRSFVTVKEKLLREDLDKAISVTEEILFHTKFDSVESMKKIVKSAKIKGENELLNNSHYFAIFYSGSHLFPGMQVEDITSGIRYYRFLCRIDAQLEKDPVPVIEKLKETAQLLFTRQNMDAALGSERADQAEVLKKLNAFQKELPSREQEKAVYRFDMQPQKVAFTNTGGVLYNITSFDYQKYGLDYDGKYQVLKTIINLEYL